MKSELEIELMSAGGGIKIERDHLDEIQTMLREIGGSNAEVAISHLQTAHAMLDEVYAQLSAAFDAAKPEFARDES